MKKYKATPSGFVHEKTTQQTIGKYRNAKVAKEVANFMNSGGGFNGWTPAFILVAPNNP